MHYSRRCFAIEFHFDFTLITSCTIHDTQSVESLEDRCALHIQRSLVDIQAVGLVSTIWTDDVNVRGKDIVADILARTSEGSDLWLILAACLALEVLEHDVRDRQWRWELQAERQILLSVALVNFDGVVHVVDDHSVVCDVVHSAITTTSLQVTAEGCWGVWPDFDACSVLDHVSNAFAIFFFFEILVPWHYEERCCRHRYSRRYRMRRRTGQGSRQKCRENRCRTCSGQEYWCYLV